LSKALCKARHKMSPVQTRVESGCFRTASLDLAHLAQVKQQQLEAHAQLFILSIPRTCQSITSRSTQPQKIRLLANSNSSRDCSINITQLILVKLGECQKCRRLLIV
jgi:hypothetical protein